MKPNIVKRKIVANKVNKFSKRRRKTIKFSKKTLFADEYKNEKNIIQEDDEELKNIKE